MACTISSLKKWVPPRSVFSLLLVISSFLNVIPFNYSANNYVNVLSSCKFDAIYQFGDSISDTGNDILQPPIINKCGKPPYGETYFRKPTGRCSNGLILIDFLALSAELPFLDPYLNKSGSFDHGVNFASCGATALPVDEARINYLSIQLDWMYSYLDRVCRHDDNGCLKKNERALFMVGEIGGNDYKRALWEGKTMEEVKVMVPRVVQAIKYAVKKVIEYGAARIVVPGNFPIGCFPVYLNQFPSDDNAYDELHCLKDVNNLAMHHNDHLRQTIKELQEEHPNVIVIYGNLYDAFLSFFSKANLLGFDPKSLQKACCGVGGGDYNFVYDRQCATDPEETVCPNPEERVSWDGVHLTQRAYGLVAEWLIRDIYPKLQCKHIDSYRSAV